MKLVTFDKGGTPRFGAVAGNWIIDLEEASVSLSAMDPSIKKLPSRIEAFIADSGELSASAQSIVSYISGNSISAPYLLPKDTVELLPPVVSPPKIICVGRNYAEHAKEAGMEISPIPILFARFANTLVADGKPVVVPAVSDSLDWEGELAVIIGKSTKGKRITKAEAMDYVFGYSLFNDVTVRDYQFRISQYTAGKNFRSSGPFGPTIVTADEIPDPHNLQLRTLLNGKVEQDANTASMIFDIPTILEHIADFIDLEPGDVIPTGTPAGVGFKRKPPVFLRDGDTVTVEIPEIGQLISPVVKERA
jgi:2-keto-4-pentenoate hydratase/2-oxohepta-3-ene-1,7-dioic acid hydratase in catechol pathway